MRKSVGYAVLTLAAIAILGFVFFTRLLGGMRDFEVYWETGRRALAAQPLYRAEDQHYQFKYLPVFAILMAPLSQAPLAIAKAIWFAASVVLLGALLVLSVRLLPDRRVRTGVLLGASIAAMAKFYGHELVLGQANILLAVLVLWAAARMRAGREGAAGILLSLAVVVKPYAIIFFPYLLVRRRLDALMAAVLGLAGLLLLPAVRYGFAGNMALLRGWAETVSSTTASNLLNQDNVSLAGMYAKWLGVGGSATLLTVVTGAILVVLAGIVLFRRDRLPFPEYLEIALLLTLIPLLSPQGWDYVFLVATPAVVCLVNYFDAVGPPYKVLTAVAVAVVGLTLYDVLGRALYALFMSMSIVTVCFLLIVWMLYHLRARKIA